MAMLHGGTCLVPVSEVLNAHLRSPLSDCHSSSPHDLLGYVIMRAIQSCFLYGSIGCFDNDVR